MRKVSKYSHVVSAFLSPEGDEIVVSFETNSFQSAEETYDDWCKSRKYARVSYDTYESDGEWMSGEWWLRAPKDNGRDSCGGAAGVA